MKRKWKVTQHTLLSSRYPLELKATIEPILRVKKPARFAWTVHQWKRDTRSWWIVDNGTAMTMTQAKLEAENSIANIEEVA